MSLFRVPKAFFRTQLLINNEWCPSSTGATFPVINPATEVKLADVSYGSPADISRAVTCASAAFESGPWPYLQPVQRSRLLSSLADLIYANREDLARVESLNSGKPLSQTLNMELQMVVDLYRYYAGYTDKIFGKTIPMNGPYMTYTRYEPKGVVGQIIPWNFPLLMQAWKMAPALAAGCTLVLKPAEQTPLTALMVGELAVQAGFPPGVVNIVPGFADTGAALVVHPKVNKIAFTGSTEVGLSILQHSGQKGLKRLTLELGGKSPNIIFDDADVDLALTQAFNGIFFNQGQSCDAGSRLFIQEGIYDEFLRRLVEMCGKRVIGDPFDEKTEQGPQVDKEQFEKVLGYIDIGKAEGAKLVCGGKRWGEKGYYIEPTVFVDVHDDMRIAREEIFGPVLCVFKFKTVEEVIKRANDSEYGLAAGVVTRDIEKAVKVTNSLKSGTVCVNCYAVTTEGTPFGGYKKSGVGRELGEEGIKEYLELKTVIVKTSDDTLQ